MLSLSHIYIWDRFMYIVSIFLSLFFYFLEEGGGVGRGVLLDDPRPGHERHLRPLRLGPCQRSDGLTIEPRFGSTNLSGQWLSPYFQSAMDRVTKDFQW